MRLDWPRSEPEFSKDATWDGYLAVISGVAGRALEAQLRAHCGPPRQTTGTTAALNETS